MPLFPRRLAMALSLAFILPVTPATAGQATALADAETLIAGHAATSAADLTTLYRLQLAANRYTDGEATLDRLQALYDRTEPGRANGLLPWRVYARARLYAQAYDDPQAAFPAAFTQAFTELYASLPDRRMADVLPWWTVNFGRLRAEADRTAAACGGTPLATCPTGDQAVAAREALTAWEAMAALAPRLVRADAERRFIIDDQLLVPTPDSAQIALIVVRPRTVTGDKLVALLNFTIYARDDWSLADAVKMAAYGYAGAVAYTRGKGRGPGSAVPYIHDGADAATVIGWLARQDWSDGRVGMFSGSYNASTQWAAAKHHPPALKAIATNASNAPGIDTPMRGNVFQSFVYPWPLYTTDLKGLDDRTYDDPARWQGLERRWYASGRPYRDLDKIDGTSNPVFDAWLDHPAYDAYWQRLLPYGPEFADVDIPVFVETGYYDGGMVGALYYLEQHYRHRPTADHRLLVGPYHHTAMQAGVLPVIDGYTIDPAARVDLQAIRLRWFDHVFHGTPLPEVLSDRINFQVMGANRWRHVASLSRMATRSLRLYLTSRREGGHFRFSRSPPAEGQAGPELTVDFADRGDVAYQPPADGPDTRNALVFTTAPLSAATEVDGLFQGRLVLRANKRDLDLAVDFYEQRADGRTLPLASYLGRASYMANRTRRHLLTPGGRTVLEFQSQTVTARLLAPGSRIIAVVGVPKRPDMQINYGTGKDVSDEFIADARIPLRVRFLPGSYLRLGTRPPGD
ncbi:CocE/NonD family hydrolase [Nitrospirillum sp. BR 11163]|uniref:CocE/NonD family hydrolase n=1 Tax=Nitrospirillum sp. BR 11163 TaxID=3104323 RepID=UPI002AFFED06|nr:CocE/NonD family hydrolase [Nitrospirillum sp. BR 11163]MEA1674188.1 CocE/NonD family hydrolase [Nitrospirillum sp. BR 11163]